MDLPACPVETALMLIGDQKTVLDAMRAWGAGCQGRERLSGIQGGLRCVR